jgi:regulator of RNase E activity RraA
LGDQIAAMAVTNGWSGIVINGCIRGRCASVAEDGLDDLLD